MNKILDEKKGLVVGSMNSVGTEIMVQFTQCGYEMGHAKELHQARELIKKKEHDFIFVLAKTNDESSSEFIRSLLTVVTKERIVLLCDGNGATYTPPPQTELAHSLDSAPVGSV